MVAMGHKNAGGYSIQISKVESVGVKLQISGGPQLATCGDPYSGFDRSVPHGCGAEKRAEAGVWRSGQRGGSGCITSGA